MNAAGAEPALRNFKTASWSGDDVIERYPNIGKAHLAVTEGRIIRAKHGQHALDLDAGSVERNQNHGMTLVPGGGAIGQTHEDEQSAVRMANSGTPPFPAVKDDLVPLDEGCSLHVGRIRRGDVGFRHTEGGPNLAGQQRREPT